MQICASELVAYTPLIVDGERSISRVQYLSYSLHLGELHSRTTLSIVGSSLVVDTDRAG